jgi:hypothetical protein
MSIEPTQMDNMEIDAHFIRALGHSKDEKKRRRVGLRLQAGIGSFTGPISSAL